MKSLAAPKSTVIAGVFASLTFACGEAEQAPNTGAWFVENAEARGLIFEHRRGNEERHWFPEIMGAGVGLLDFDADGDLDVYLVQSGDLETSGPDAPGNQLFENRGDGTFEDISAGSGADDKGYGMGCAAGDYDGDGDTDIYVTNVGANVLLRNDGNGTFTDVSRQAGVDHDGWGTSAAFFDADGDRDLDLFVVNYIHWSPALEVACDGPVGSDYCSPNTYDAPAADVLFENRGDGTFVDASKHAGIASSFGNGLGLAIADYDGDGAFDVYVANDMMPNQLWMNAGDGTFRDRALISGCAANRNGESEAGMGTVAFDLENDGDADLFMTHLRGETNTLYVNENGSFSDRTAPLGLAGPSLRSTGFGVVLADFDQDGRLDAFIANGAVTRNRPPLDPEDPYAEPNQLFRGLEVGFEEITPLAGPGPELIETSRGAASGDLDGDGDVDVVVIDSGSAVRLYENVAASGHWVRFDVREANGAPAIGAAVRVRTAREDTAATFWRSVAPAASYCSSIDPATHFGLGKITGDVVALVRWPHGEIESFGPFEVDATHVLQRGSGVRD